VGVFTLVNHQSVWIECPVELVKPHLETPAGTVVIKEKRMGAICTTGFRRVKEQLQDKIRLAKQTSFKSCTKYVGDVVTSSCHV